MNLECQNIPPKDEPAKIKIPTNTNNKKQYFQNICMRNPLDQKFQPHDSRTHFFAKKNKAFNAGFCQQGLLAFMSHIR